MAEIRGENLQIGGTAREGRIKPQEESRHECCDGKDYEILRILQHNGRTPFLEMARKIGVSGATVHERVRNLANRGIIEGFTANIDYKKLGYEVTAIIGVTLEHPSLDLKKLRDGLLGVPEIVEAHNLTGDTDLLLTMRTKSIDDLRDLLTNRVQNLSGVRRLSTSIVLDSPVARRAVEI